MKTFLLSALLGGSALLSMAQGAPEKLYDKDHTVDLLVVYDDTDWRYAESQQEREAYAREVVNSLNLVLRNSNIDDYCYRVAGTHHWAGYKAPSIDEGWNDISWDEGIAQKRKETKADIVLFLTENQDSNSGVAKPSATHSDAFACVRLSMAASAYTAAHEIGHILGANHSDSPNEQQPSNHPWAKGYVSPEGYMTVLCSMGTSLPIYSGPKSVWTTDDGRKIVMGDDTHDNVRMIESLIPYAVHFGDLLEPNMAYAAQTEMRFDKHEQNGEVRVASNQFMQIRSNNDWISAVSPNLCSYSDANVTFKLAPNHTGQDRVGSLVLSGDAPEKEIKIIQTAADIVIDSDHGTYQLKTDNFVDKAQFVRTFEDTEWQPLYVPFLWRNSDWKELFDIAELKAVLPEKNGEMVLDIHPLTTENIQANVPYLIRAKKASSYVLNLEHVNFFPATIHSTVLTADNKKFTFIGTHEGICGQDMYNQRFYNLSKGVLAPNEDVNTKLGAFRWYLDITDETGKPIETTVCIKIGGQDGPTGIEGTALDHKTELIYDLNGRVVKKEKDLQPGIYVINGKKVIK